MKSIGLWLDETSDMDEKSWIVSLDDDNTGNTVTLDAFPKDDYASALLCAKDEAHQRGLQVIES